MGKNKHKKGKLKNVNELVKGDSNQFKQNINNENTFENRFDNTKNRFS